MDTNDIEQDLIINSCLLIGEQHHDDHHKLDHLSTAAVEKNAAKLTGLFHSGGGDFPRIYNGSSMWRRPKYLDLNPRPL